MAKTKPAAKSKTKPKTVAKRSVPAPTAVPIATENSVSADATIAKPKTARMLPTKDELKSLYSRYTENTTFDDHDKAFYFVLDVGGLGRARQLLAHVEE